MGCVVGNCVAAKGIVSCSVWLSFFDTPGFIHSFKYLLCIVGSVYIRTKEAPAKEIKKDLVEMCRGIQHPLRVLFLRSYLSQVSRDKLPEIGPSMKDENTVMDAVEFLLQNFKEGKVSKYIRLAVHCGFVFPARRSASIADVVLSTAAEDRHDRVKLDQTAHPLLNANQVF
ncbi:hypothetical protein Lser_V15G33748 [Lactuca serriola]